MALDFWSSSYDPVEHESGLCELPGWQCDFYFGYGRDVIEEDALNKKYCMQVLRILTGKADTEFEELGKKLISYQNELEHEDLPQTFYDASDENINCAEVSISSVNNDASDVEDQSPLCKNPCKSMHEKLKPFDVISSNPTSDGTGHAEDLLGENRKDDNLHLNVVVKEEKNELNPASADSRRLSHFLKFQENNSDNPEKIEVADVKIKSLCEDDLNDADNLSSGKKQSWIINMKPSNFEGQQDNSCMDPNISFSLHSLDKEQPVNLPVKAQDSSTIGHSIKQSNGVKRLCMSDFREATGRQPPPLDKSEISDSSSFESMGSLAREAKPANIVEDDSLDALRLEIVEEREKCSNSKKGFRDKVESRTSDLNKRLCDFAIKTSRKVCTKEAKITPAEGMGSVKSFPSFPSKQYKRKYSMEGSNKQEAYSTDIEISSSTEKGNNNVVSLKVENANLDHAEEIALAPLLKLQNENSLDSTKPQRKNERKVQAESLKTTSTVNMSKSSMSLALKMRNRGKRKRELELDPDGAEKLGQCLTKVVSDSSSMVNPNKRGRCKAGSRKGSLIKTAKQSVQTGLYEAEENKGTSCSSSSSSLEFQEIRKEAPKFPSKNSAPKTDSLSSQDTSRVSSDSGKNEDLQTIMSYLIANAGSSTESSVVFPSALVSSENMILNDLKVIENMTLSDLKAIAKLSKLRKYHKLRKQDLLDQIVDRLSRH